MENIEIVPLYFAARRPTVERDGLLLMVDDERFRLAEGEKLEMRSIRFRTLGCYPLTGAVESNATTLPEVIQEMLRQQTAQKAVDGSGKGGQGSTQMNCSSCGTQISPGWIACPNCGAPIP